MTKKHRCHGYQRIPFPLSTPSKNRTIAKVSFNRQGRLATGALLGLAAVRFASASAAHHRKASALIGLMTWVSQP
jgi:hypothetical protein